MMTSPKPHPEKSRIGSGFAVSRRLQSVFGILTLVGGRAIRTTGIGSGSVGWPRLITLEGAALSTAVVFRVLRVS